jgi:hypothetical protein
LRGRLLLLDDHENLCGGPDAPAAVSGAVWEALIDALSLTAADNAVVGLSDFGAKNFMSALPMGHIKLVVGRGRDGADHALIDAVDPQHVAERFHSVVIASGDHIFADLAWRLRDLGLLVCNVTAGGARAARSLARACQCHTRLRIDLRDRNMLARLAAARPASHGFEGAWIARQVR